MNNKDRNAALIDGILRFGVTTSAIAAGLLIPNLLIGLEKPLNIFWKGLDKRERERELRKTISYMKSKKLLHENYQYGLQITDKGRRRLEKLDFEEMIIEKPKYWDKMWRLIFFDIPEDKKYGRDLLTNKLKSLGFYQLQKSAWVHPFPCRSIIEKVTSEYKIDNYVTYVEVTYIDNQEKLKEKFANIL